MGPQSRSGSGDEASPSPPSRCHHLPGRKAESSRSGLTDNQPPGENSREQGFFAEGPQVPAGGLSAELQGAGVTEGVGGGPSCSEPQVLRVMGRGREALDGWGRGDTLGFSA